MIDIATIRARFDALSPYLNERTRRLAAALEAQLAGWGGVTAVSAATGMARSTIRRGLAELGSADVDLNDRIRRVGGGRKPKTETPAVLIMAKSTIGIGAAGLKDQGGGGGGSTLKASVSSK